NVSPSAIVNVNSVEPSSSKVTGIPVDDVHTIVKSNGPNSPTVASVCTCLVIDRPVKSNVFVAVTVVVGTAPSCADGITIAPSGLIEEDVAPAVSLSCTSQLVPTGSGPKDWEPPSTRPNDSSITLWPCQVHS